jgi:hypothetical protein
MGHLSVVQANLVGKIPIFLPFFSKNDRTLGKFP